MRKQFMRFVSLGLCLWLLIANSVPALATETSGEKAAEGWSLTIRTVEEFLEFAENCRLDSYSRNANVYLVEDLDLTDADFSSIPIFCGTFYGNDHKITGLKLTGNGSAQGLFRYLTETAAVKQLHVSGTVVPQGSRGQIGGIAGSNAGTIADCSFSGQVTGGDRIGGIAGSNLPGGVIENCEVDGVISGSHFVGGIAGENLSVIRNCENRAGVNVTPQDNSIDISDITIGTITGTESAGTVTDIGGIAGTSTGTVAACVNRGDVGYKHMGYNVGGIAGSQSGYLADCENFGAVSGRKEVGGIVGHMEPSIVLRYETDTLQILSSQLEILADLTDKAVLNTQENMAALQALVTTLEYHVANAEAAIEVLRIDPEDPQIRDWDTYTAAVQTLSSSIAGIDHTMRSIYRLAKESGDGLSRDMEAVSRQMDVINGILDAPQENLGGALADVSDRDTPEDLTSKLTSCVNRGDVLGDLNVGGLVGAIALENDLDPEADIGTSGDVSLNVAGQMRSVVTASVNHGSVHGKKQNTGGIIGWQGMGLVKQTLNMGVVAGGDYTGGIAGMSQGYLRDCYANCTVTGGSYTGGIAGTGATVTGCRSLVAVTGSECVGAILGIFAENPAHEAQSVWDNFYVCTGKDPGAIDGISYDTQAQPLDLEKFLALEALPEEFGKVTVTFSFPDGTVQTVTQPVGMALKENIPQLPALEGYTGAWEGLPAEGLESVFFDLHFTAVYTAHGQTLAAHEMAGGKPVLLLTGQFAPGVVLQTQLLTDSAPEVSEGWILAECRGFVLTGQCHITSARYLLGVDADPEKLSFYVRSGQGQWRKAEFTVDGSYGVIALEEGDDAIALLISSDAPFPWEVVGVAAAVLIVAAATVILLRKRKKKTSPDGKVSENA